MQSALMHAMPFHVPLSHPLLLLSLHLPPPPTLIPSLTHTLPVPYLSGLPRTHKGMGTDSIFDFSHPPVQPPVNFLKLYNTYYVNMSCPLFPSLTLILSLNLPCPLSLTPPLSLLYHFLTHPYPSLTFTLWSLTSYKFVLSNLVWQ